MISILMSMAMLAGGGEAAVQANARGFAGCPATYKAAKALLKGAPRLVQGGREPGDEAYATFREYPQARPRILGATATGMLIHTPLEGSPSEVGRVVIRLPGADRDRFLPAFDAVYGEDTDDGEFSVDDDEKLGNLNEASLNNDSGPFAVFKQHAVYLLCLYNY